MQAHWITWIYCWRYIIWGILDQIVTKTKPQQRFKKLVQTAIPKPVTIEDTLEVIGGKAQFMIQIYTEASSWGWYFQKRSGIMIFQILVDRNGLLKGKRIKGNSEREVGWWLPRFWLIWTAYSKENWSKEIGLCNGCGSNHTVGRECLLLGGHPDYNHSSQPWEDSTLGNAWAEQIFSNLLWKKTLDGKGWNCPQSVEEYWKEVSYGTAYLLIKIWIKYKDYYYTIFG